tara:strand:+ start:227 stop:349 length:123 start_codon:yes stop_codon:yes gene_type:complete
MFHSITGLKLFAARKGAAIFRTSTLYIGIGSRENNGKVII